MVTLLKMFESHFYVIHEFEDIFVKPLVRFAIRIGDLYI